MFEFFNDIGNYESRKIGKEEVNGLEVSTCYTSDEGYETALLDEVSVYPVERYASKEEAIAGHQKWMKEAETIEKVTCLGGFGGIVDDKEVTLIRKTK